MRGTKLLVLTGSAPSFQATGALAHSLEALQDSEWVIQVQSTGTPSFVTDALLAVRDLSGRAREKRQGTHYPIVIYPKIKDDSSAGLTRPSALLTFLLSEREVGYPCIIDDVRRTVCTDRFSRISPLTVVADAIKIASGDFPSEQSATTTVPTLERDAVDSLRNHVHHWIRPLDGLDLSGLLDRRFKAFRAAFEQWDENWHDRHHWRSFYAVCLWFSSLPDRLPSRNGVQPGKACWKKWSRLFVLSYDGCWNEAAELFKDNQKALKYCIQWIHKV